MSLDLNEESFNRIIEFDGGNSDDGVDDEEKENASGIPLIRKRPTQEQYKLMENFFGNNCVFRVLLTYVRLPV